MRSARQANVMLTISLKIIMIKSWAGCKGLKMHPDLQSLYLSQVPWIPLNCIHVDAGIDLVEIYLAEQIKNAERNLSGTPTTDLS